MLTRALSASNLFVLTVPRTTRMVALWGPQAATATYSCCGAAVADRSTCTSTSPAAEIAATPASAPKFESDPIITKLLADVKLSPAVLGCTGPEYVPYSSGSERFLGP